MLSKDQTQDVSDSATAVQAGNNANVQVVHNHGLSYSEVRQVALDVFTANYYTLAGAAKEIARVRAEEVTEAFLKKLQEEHPEGLSKSEDPDFQHGLLTIQKEYARTGDKELGDLLIDLLVDRSKQDQRNILQIVLNESLSTAPKLTSAQLSVLAVIFLFTYTQNHGIGNHEELGNYLDHYILPFIDSLVTNRSCYQHLEFTGCGNKQMGEMKLENRIGKVYQGLFLKGFDRSEVEKKDISIGLDGRFFIQCLNDPTKIQINSLNEGALEKDFNTYSIGEDDRKKILDLFNTNKMNSSEIKELCIKLRPYMETLFCTWNDSYMKSFTLTSVGMAIGHANVKRLLGEFSDLSIWIN